MSAVGNAPDTIDALLALAAAPNSSWRFVPLATQRLDAGKRNPELIALLAAHAVRLGLRTLALDALDALPDDFADDPQVGSLRDAARALRPDTLTPERRVALARANCDALGAAGGELRASLDEWSRRASGAQAFVTTDRNIALRADPSRPFAFQMLCDARARATAAWKPSPLAADDPTGAPPVFVAGFRTPCLLERVIAGTPIGATGYSPRIWLYEPDQMHALDALSFRDLRGVLTESRLLAFLGAGAGERLAEAMGDHAEEHLPREIVIDDSAACANEASRMVRDAADAQVREHEQLHAAIATRAGNRDARFWADRFESATSDDPLRVMIATTRYSTVMHASATGLAEGLRENGCAAEVLAEPDTHARMSSLAYLRRIDAFDPDLIVLINFPRSMLSSAVPRGVPCLTWVQDMMPHLVDPSHAAKATPLDLAVGGLSLRITEALGLRRWAHTRFPIVASTRKFRRVEAHGADEFACETAYIGNQSEPLAELVARFKKTLAPLGVDTRFVEEIQRAIVPLLDDPSVIWANELRAATIGTVESLTGKTPRPFEVERLVSVCVQPLADRMLRHQTLEWAAWICARRGWRFRIFGRGWERHPTLAAHAQGPVAHGEPLREIYRTSAATLHASVTVLAHQRVLECALSGGITLCRHIEDAVAATRNSAIVSAMLRGVASRDDSVHPDATPELLKFAAHLERLNRPAEASYTVRDALYLDSDPEEVIAYERSPLELLVHPERVLFTTESALESMLERTVNDRAWRDTTSDAIAEHTKSHASDDALARTMIDLTRTAMRAASLSD